MVSNSDGVEKPKEEEKNVKKITSLPRKLGRYIKEKWKLDGDQSFDFYKILQNVR